MAPVVVAVNASVVEMLLDTVPLIATHTFVYRGTWVLYPMLTVIAAISALMSHSGYLTSSGDHALHTLHHRLFNVNYGANYYVLDRVFGSYCKPMPATALDLAQ